MEQFALLYNLESGLSKVQGFRRKNRIKNNNTIKANELKLELEKYETSSSLKDISSTYINYLPLIGSVNIKLFACAVFLFHTIGFIKDNTVVSSMLLDKCLATAGYSNHSEEVKQNLKVGIFSYYLLISIEKSKT